MEDQLHNISFYSHVQFERFKKKMKPCACSNSAFGVLAVIYFKRKMWINSIVSIHWTSFGSFNIFLFDWNAKFQGSSHLLGCSWFICVVLRENCDDSPVCRHAKGHNLPVDLLMCLSILVVFTSAELAQHLWTRVMPFLLY